MDEWESSNYSNGAAPSSSKAFVFGPPGELGDNPRKIKYSRGAEKDGILDPFESGGSLWALLVAWLILECALELYI